MPSGGWRRASKGCDQRCAAPAVCTARCGPPGRTTSTVQQYNRAGQAPSKGLVASQDMQAVISQPASSCNASQSAVMIRAASMLVSAAAGSSFCHSSRVVPAGSDYAQVVLR